jgi:hypothetical protein
MTMTTTNTIKLFARTLVPAFALLLSLAGCGEADKPDKKAVDKTDKTAKVDGDKTKDLDTPEVGTPEPEMPDLDPKVEKAVTLANQLAAEPSRADAILEEAGMDRTTFQTLLYDIARDPELSKSYAVAREA